MDEIPITFNSDEKGFFDRECPKCEYIFKIDLEDWKNKVSDEKVYCPMCGCIENSEKWWTQKQINDMEKFASNFVMSMLSDMLDDNFGKLARDTRNNKYVKVTYRPGEKITFNNNPLGQSEEWELEIICEMCGTRYSVIGLAYFCPCCGNNAIESIFDNHMDSINKMIDSSSEMEELFTQSYGKDTANTMIRKMVEGSLGDIVSSFQKYAASKYKLISGENARVNDFQIVYKGSDLFRNVYSKGYEEWLSDCELATMNLYFQRRHLVEHNNGMVDERYIEKSGDVFYSVGQRIVVKKEDVYELIKIVRKLGDGLRKLN
ncbi:hypothetical protein [Acetobacterium tundrae]|uniref:HEPN/Toprim N-terminal domain-containing protein n=1 Tax=Acetobacterium tundrae TaxID=132932 RepID=A0ABR6WHW0_9FIRM|nr:hypothetical protein [Acetobacterium tundrae]MBC3796036.1 hypothetical protein [Acetobacterium tundrae]